MDELRELLKEMLAEDGAELKVDMSELLIATGEATVRLGFLVGDKDFDVAVRAERDAINMKFAIAIDPNGQPGARITLLSPLFDDVSPAIQALRSQRFEQYKAIVVDGPPLWLASLEPILDTMDRNNIHETPQALMQDIIDLASTKGLTIDYTQGI